MAGSLLGGGSGLDLRSLVQLASNFNLDATAAEALVPIVLEFLKSRLSPALLATIQQAVPLLAGAQAGKLSGLAGLASKLF
jgi:hypothetical protein